MTPEELAAQKAAADEAAKKAAEDAIDPEVEAIAKDPKAVKALLEAKRAANAEAKKLRLEREALDAAAKAKEDEALKEQGKFKELAEKHKAEADKAKADFNALIVDTAIKVEALQAGAIDPDDVRRLLDRASVKLAADGQSVEGAAEAVAALKKAKPHLFKGEETPNKLRVRTEGPASLHGIKGNPDQAESAEDLLSRGIANGPGIWPGPKPKNPEDIRRAGG